MEGTHHKREREDNSEDQVAKKAASSPLSRLNISSNEFLFGLSRAECPTCGARRKFFCYECFISLIPPSAGKVPQLTLPISLHIIHEPYEMLSKSTATHAKILAPGSVTIADFPELPDHLDPSSSVLLFPSKDATSVREYDFTGVETVVVIDSTWGKAKNVLRDERIRALPCVKIEDYETMFWRWQRVGKTCLSTIEAIYYFYKELHTRTVGRYDGEMDDMLFFFAHMYDIIQKRYKNEPGKEFRKIEGYIQYDDAEDSSTS